MEQQSSAAKFAFFYMLSLVALIFMALSTGMIIFQIINKNIADISSIFPGMFDSGVLKFAISAIIIATPIYYLTTWQINKSLFAGALNKDSGIRKWLTYFILFASSVVMLGWLVGTIYNFLDGELTLKFTLKALTSIAIAAAVFTYYFYDIRRENVVGVKDRIIQGYFYASIIIVLAALISSFFFVESPTETRNRKQDMEILNRFDRIDGAINNYYFEKKKLPENLNELVGTSKGYYLREEDLQNPITKEKFEYKLKSANNYEICANFKSVNKGEKRDFRYDYYSDRWPHEVGYQCLEQRIRPDVKGAQSSEKPMEAPLKD